MCRVSSENDYFTHNKRSDRISSNYLAAIILCGGTTVGSRKGGITTQSLMRKQINYKPCPDNDKDLASSVEVREADQADSRILGENEL